MSDPGAVLAAVVLAVVVAPFILLALEQIADWMLSDRTRHRPRPSAAVAC